MNINNLFEIQAKLDERIIDEHGLRGEDLLDKKILALQVELGELANELPEVFKFWANKKNNYEEALKEYVDGLHFILSIGLELGFADVEVTCDYTEDTVTGTFNRMFETIGDLRHCYEIQSTPAVEKVYEVAFQLLVGLGSQLGFTWNQIEQAYLAKNKINHERQNNGY